MIGLEFPILMKMKGFLDQKQCLRQLPQNKNKVILSNSLKVQFHRELGHKDFESRICQVLENLKLLYQYDALLNLLVLEILHSEYI